MKQKSKIRLKYSCVYFVENRELQKFMNAFDMTDCGHKCFGSFHEAKFNKDKPFTKAEMDRFLKAIEEDERVHMVFLNGTLIYNRGIYAMLSNGEQWVKAKEVKEFNDEANN